MADLDVQRRRAPGPWPWVVGLLVLALLVWGAVELLDRGAASGLERTAAPPAGAAS